MIIPFKKIIYTTIFNFSLLTLLVVGIQNSSNTKKVNFILKESVNLPTSFIIGISFISGSLSGSFITNFINQKK